MLVTVGLGAITADFGKGEQETMIRDAKSAGQLTIGQRIFVVIMLFLGLLFSIVVVRYIDPTATIGVFEQHMQSEKRGN